MSEPVQLPNMKHLMIILWIALGTAIVVTLIDWKIKNDMLTCAKDFYLAIGKEVPDGDKAGQSAGNNSVGDVLRFPVVDSHSRMEAQTPTVPIPAPRFATPNGAGDSESTTASDSGQVPSPTVGVAE